MKPRSLLIGLIMVTLLGIFPGLNTLGQDDTNEITKIPEYAPNRVIIKFKENNTRANSAYNVASQLGVSSHRRLHMIDAEIWEISIPVDEAIAQYQNHPAIEYIEPDYIVSVAETIPNDANFSQLWGLHNTGQNGGKFDADIDAPEAWDLETGDNRIIVAVIDSGIDYTHTDLATNMWMNPGELAGNGIDDDGNGYIDDLYGIDLWNGDSDPMDDNGHGTHCAGIIGANGDNGIGVAGVAWDVQIMSLKFLNNNGHGYTSGALESIQYAIDHGANILSNSWSGQTRSQALYDMLVAAKDADILVVAAASNNSRNIDVVPAYPASYDLDNIISVAATNRNDNLAGFSNFGQLSVDVAAPGEAILSTVPNNAYAIKDGTSMATPYVSGLAVLVKAHYPSLSWVEIKDRILYTTDRLESLQDKVLTGGRINAYNALTTEKHPQLSYYGLDIDDTGALQPNGVLEPGETTNFYVALKNDWAQADLVTATLSSPDSYLAISQGISTYGDMGAGEIKENLTPFVISLAAETPPGHVLPFEIDLTYQYDSQIYSVTLPFTYTPAGGNAWLYVTDTVDDSDATWPNELWEPGETIDFYVALQNDWAASENISATLSTTDNFVMIEQAIASYGDRFLIGEIKNNETPFVIHLDPAASADRKIAFKLTLTYSRHGVAETKTIPFTYSATRIKIVKFPEPEQSLQNTTFLIDGDVGYLPTINRNVLWSFSTLTGELLDEDGLDLPGYASDISVFSHDRLAFPGWFPNQSIFVVDASNPANLRKQGIISFPSTTNIQAQHIEVDDDGTTGYVIGYPDDSLYSFNVDTMSVVDSLPLPGDLDRFARAGDRIALADHDNGRILVADVSNPANLIMAGVIELPGTNTFSSDDNIIFAADGRTGFISSNERVLYSFDVIDVELLDPDGFTFGNQGYGGDIAIHGNTVAAIWSRGLTFIDVSDPTNLQILSNANFGRSVAPQGNATVAFLQDGSLAAMPVIYPNYLVYVFDVVSGQQAAEPITVTAQPNYLTSFGSDHRIGVVCTGRSTEVFLLSYFPVPEPDVAIEPTSFTVEASYGETISRPLTINNTGFFDLNWSIVEDSPVPWLDVQPVSGIVSQSGSNNAELIFSPPTMTAGTYTTTLQVMSNDPDEKLLNVQITLNVPDHYFYFFPVILRDD